jgi:hypothetical protein
VREHFSRHHTCPIERIVVSPRPDLPPHVISPGPPPDPPAAVRDDPERLRLWMARFAEENAQYDRQNTSFETRGCGEHVLEACSLVHGGARCDERAVPE